MSDPPAKNSHDIVSIVAIEQQAKTFSTVLFEVLPCDVQFARVIKNIPAKLFLHFF
jgi:hypothetical protein